MAEPEPMWRQCLRHPIDMFPRYMHRVPHLTVGALAVTGGLLAAMNPLLHHKLRILIHEGPAGFALHMDEQEWSRKQRRAAMFQLDLTRNFHGELTTPVYERRVTDYLRAVWLFESPEEMATRQAHFHHSLAEVRAKLMSQAKGDVLQLGSFSGTNLPFIPSPPVGDVKTCTVVHENTTDTHARDCAYTVASGVFEDPDIFISHSYPDFRGASVCKQTLPTTREPGAPDMAATEIKVLNPNPFLRFYPGGHPHDVRFQDNTFDTVVSVGMLCRCDHPKKVLRSLRRVCKPDGKLLLLEHGAPINPLLRLVTWPVLSRISNRGAFIPHQHTLNIVDEVKQAGFVIESRDSFLFGTVHAIVANPDKLV